VRTEARLPKERNHMKKKMVIYRTSRAAQDSRLDPTAQITQIPVSMRRFGVVSPALVYRDGNIISGRPRTLAASHLGLTWIPLIILDPLIEAQVRLRIAGNKMVESAWWDDGAGDRRLTEMKTNTNDKDNQ
jgi:ParB-like chromosome segregation protein Spo0J